MNISDAIWFVALAIFMHGCMSSSTQKIDVICKTIEHEKTTNDTKTDK